MRELYGPGQRVPVYAWSSALGDDTARQLVRIASQPWVSLRVAAMADAHVCEHVAVGTVFASEHHVVPAALGGDLGCGVRAVRFPGLADAVDRDALEPVLAALARVIPVGDALHRGAGADVPDALLAPPLSTRALEHARLALCRRHLGTLGGGNHFVELARAVDGDAWLLVHSGSRGLGKAVAQHHTSTATATSDAGELPALDARTPAGAAYLDDLAWALDFARHNRAELARRASDVLTDATGIAPADTVDVHHNHVARESHDGGTYLVHRKGAMRAGAGERGVIPGSMATATYLVEGLGCARAFASCSHGAGRVMTRKEALQRVDLRAFDRQMRRVVHDRSKRRSLVEESPDAYRDIRAVLDDQRELVRPVTRLEPMLVLKG